VRGSRGAPDCGASPRRLALQRACERDLISKPYALGALLCPLRDKGIELDQHEHVT
jgi:hypothetical protein